MKRIRTLLQLTVFVQLVSALVVGAEAGSNAFGNSAVKVPTTHTVSGSNCFGNS